MAALAAHSIQIQAALAADVSQLRLRGSSLAVHVIRPRCAVSALAADVSKLRLVLVVFALATPISPSSK